MMTVTPDNLAWRTFQECINERPINSVTDCWASRRVSDSYHPWFVFGSQTRIKEGLVYGIGSPSPLGLGPRTSGMAHSLNLLYGAGPARPWALATCRNIWPSAHWTCNHNLDTHWGPIQVSPNQMQLGQKCDCSRVPYLGCLELS